MKEEMIWNCYINIDKEFLEDKDINYKYYSLYNVVNKYNLEYNEFIRNKKKYIKELEELSNNKKRSIMENFNKLYDIINKKDGQCINIKSDILKLLISNTNNNTIKIYCLLLKECNEQNFKILSDEYIGNYLNINRKTVYRSVEELCRFNLIEKTKTINTDQVDLNGNSLTKGFNSYKLLPYEMFKNSYDNKPIDTQTNKPKNNTKKSKSKGKRVVRDYEYYYIYLITELDTNMKYIGKHYTTNLDDGYMGSGTVLKQNQKLKGLDNYEKEIIQFCKDKAHMDTMERFWIERYKAYENDNFYNLV